MKPSNATRMPELDLLRLVAVLLVIGRHSDPIPKSLPVSLGWFFDLWHCGGWVGVDLFFVLSGFLVSGLLFREYKLRRRVSLGRFYMRRGWKIYPPFFALIAVTVFWQSCQHGGTPPSQLTAEVFFVQNYFGGLWDHTWSLAVEEHFYILLPLILVILLKLRGTTQSPFKPIVGIALLVGLVTLALRIANSHMRSGFYFETHLFATHLRLDALFFRCCDCLRLSLPSGTLRVDDWLALATYDKWGGHAQHCLHMADRNHALRLHVWANAVLYRKRHDPDRRAVLEIAGKSRGDGHGRSWGVFVLYLSLAYGSYALGAANDREHGRSSAQLLRENRDLYCHVNRGWDCDG